MNEPKPCPFCGNLLEIVHKNGSKYVRCISGICIFETARHGYHISDGELIKRCNRRPAEDALKAEVERLKSDLGIQKNLTNQACFESNRAYQETEKWKKMFYDLIDKQSNVSTDPKVIVVGKDTNVPAKEREGGKMSRMTHSKCGECRNYFECDSACENDWACEDFEPQGKTLFDRITAYPEVLAPKFIYEATTCDGSGHVLSGYKSTIIAGFWLAESEAIAATVEKLKEVCDE